MGDFEQILTILDAEKLTRLLDVLTDKAFEGIADFDNVTGDKGRLKKVDSFNSKTIESAVRAFVSAGLVTRYDEDERQIYLAQDLLNTSSSEERADLLHRAINGEDLGATTPHDFSATLAEQRRQDEQRAYDEQQYALAEQRRQDEQRAYNEQQFALAEQRRQDEQRAYDEQQFALAEQRRQDEQGAYDEQQYALAEQRRQDEQRALDEQQFALAEQRPQDEQRALDEQHAQNSQPETAPAPRIGVGPSRKKGYERGSDSAAKPGSGVPNETAASLPNVGQTETGRSENIMPAAQTPAVQTPSPRGARPMQPMDTPAAPEAPKWASGSSRLPKRTATPTNQSSASPEPHPDEPTQRVARTPNAPAPQTPSAADVPDRLRNLQQRAPTLGRPGASDQSAPDLRGRGGIRGFQSKMAPQSNAVPEEDLRQLGISPDLWLDASMLSRLIEELQPRLEQLQKSGLDKDPVLKINLMDLLTRIRSQMESLEQEQEGDDEPNTP